MAATVEVRFKGNRKDYFLWPDEAEPLRLSDPVIVPADRGLDFGRVSAVGRRRTKKCSSGCSGCAVGETKTPEFAVVRRATQEEISTANDLRRSEEDTRRTVLERVRARQLDMKVSDAEWQFDRKKLTVYFTAEKRVDFRDLVRDLASILHTRIDLRQIGARDEAARLSGVGRCGKEYCCSTWLTEPLAGEPGAGQGSAPLAQSGADLRRVRPAALLPQVRARVLRHGAQALPQGGQDAADQPRGRAGGGGGHLPRAGLPPERGAGPAHHFADRLCGGARAAGRAAARGAGPAARARAGGRARSGPPRPRPPRRRPRCRRPADSPPEPHQPRAAAEAGLGRRSPREPLRRPAAAASGAGGASGRDPRPGGGASATPPPSPEP